MPIHGKNIWRLCKTYGRLIGAPELKPHDLRHGVAMEVLEQQHDLEQVRALLGHKRIDTTQIYASIRPAQLKRAAAMQFMSVYVEHFLVRYVDRIEPDTPLFWSSWGRRGVGKTRAPMTGKNIWRLCKVYGRIIGYPELKPHDLRHGVAMEVLEQHHDLEQVRALLGHARIDTTQIYASIRPTQLKRSVEFLDAKASRMLKV